MSVFSYFSRDKNEPKVKISEYLRSQNEPEKGEEPRKPEPEQPKTA